MSSEPTQENLQQLLDDNLQQTFVNLHKNNIEEKKEVEQDPQHKQDDAQNQLLQTEQSDLSNQTSILLFENEDNKSQKEQQSLDSFSHQIQEPQPVPKMDEANIIQEEKMERKKLKYQNLKSEEEKTNEQNSNNEKFDFNEEENSPTLEQQTKIEESSTKKQLENNSVDENTYLNEQNPILQKDKEEGKKKDEGPFEIKQNLYQKIDDDIQMKSSLIEDIPLEEDIAERDEIDKSQINFIQNENISKDCGLYFYHNEKQDEKILKNQHAKQEGSNYKKIELAQNEVDETKQTRSTHIEDTNIISQDNQKRSQPEEKKESEEASKEAYIYLDINWQNCNEQNDLEIIQSKPDQSMQNQVAQDNKNGLFEESKQELSPKIFEVHQLFKDLQNNSQNQTDFKVNLEKYTLEFQENQKFAQELKFMLKCKKKVDLINKRLNDNFQIIFQERETIKQLTDNDVEKQKDIVIGCALYVKLIQVSQVQDPEKINVPTFFQKQKENIYCVLKNILLQNADYKIEEFFETVKIFDEELMKNEIFQNKLKFLIKCSKKVDLINKKLQEEFKIIFEEKDDQIKKLQEDESLSQHIVIGCALYSKIFNDSRIQQPDKINVPCLLQIVPKLQKYNEFLSLVLENEDDQETLNEIQVFLKQIEMMLIDQESQKDKIQENAKEIQSWIEIFDDRVQIQVKNLLYQAFLELKIESYFELDLFIEQAKQMLDQKQEPVIDLQKQIQEEQNKKLKAQQELEEKMIQEQLEQQIKLEIKMKIQKEFEEN